MQRVRASIEIAAPRAAVFAHLDDVYASQDLMPEVTGVGEVTPLENGGRRVVYYTKGRSGTRREAVSETLEYDPPERVVLRGANGGITTRTTRTFAELGPDRTRVDVELEFRIPVPVTGRLVELTWRRDLRRDLEGFLNRLRERVEAMQREE